jgi:hypothetical protein
MGETIKKVEIPSMPDMRLGLENAVFGRSGPYEQKKTAQIKTRPHEEPGGKTMNHEVHRHRLTGL